MIEIVCNKYLHLQLDMFAHLSLGEKHMATSDLKMVKINLKHWLLSVALV